jgi:DNA-binding transcriptional LysR family regulator
MNRKQLETFAAIVRLGSFAAAAASLNATQSTVSARIQELEQSLGVVLFDRTQRRAHLTAKGRELISYAQAAMNLFSEIEQQVGNPEALSGTVRVGVAEMVAISWLADFVSTLHKGFPNLKLEFDVNLTADLLSKLNDGELDIALIPGSRFEGDLEAKSLGKVEFAWMASPALALPKGRLSPRDFQPWRILSLGDHSYHFNTVQLWLRNGGHIQHVDTCNSMSVVASLTMAGLGISLLPPRSYAKELNAKKLRQLATDPKVPMTEFWAVYLRSRANPVITRLASIARDTSNFA